MTDILSENIAAMSHDINSIIQILDAGDANDLRNFFGGRAPG